MPTEKTAETSQMVPVEFASQWIAWSQDGTRIVASGRTLPDAVKAAAEAGEGRPIFAKVPKADVWKE